MQFDEEMLAFEAQLPNLCPAEGVDLGVSLFDAPSIRILLPCHHNQIFKTIKQ